jgi:shikimate kinase
MNIIILGYMGSGKSIIGRELSLKVNKKFIDLDSYIEEKEKDSISNIFQNNGDLYFRKQESKYLKEILNNNNDLVLSVGGGTPCYFNNLDLMISNKNISFYLKNSNIQLTSRLFNEKNKRPLISNISSEEKLLEFVSKHLFEREFFYNSATHKIDSNDKPVSHVVDDIISRLK